MIGARFEPLSLIELLGRRREMEQERLRRCLSLAEELRLAHIEGLIKEHERVEALGWERMKAETTRKQGQP